MGRRRAALRNTVLLVVAVAMLVTVVLVDRPRDVPARAAAAKGPAGEGPAGWTRLQLPPEVRSGAAFVWAGTELILWGGCDPEIDDDCRPTSDGFTFDLITSEWHRVPDAPESGAYAHAVWTGTEVVLIAEREHGSPVAQSHEPVTGTWARLPSPPLRTVNTAVWTGTQVLVWSDGSRASPRRWKGAALDMVSGEWHRIPDAPFALNLFSSVWTGTEVILFGSLLNSRNLAETTTAQGAAYSPATDSWRRLLPSTLSPQATSAALVGEEVLAWDYLTDYQVYDPALNEWTRAKGMPLEPGECYPESETVRGAFFAFYCGEAALYQPVTRTWRKVDGGPLDDHIGGRAHRYDLWRFAEMASSGEAIYLLMEGITVSKRGMACYGCPGSPQSFWVYRPPSEAAR